MPLTCYDSMYEDFAEDPEAAADEEISYLDDDGDA